jgi:hypothetical protein
MFIDPTGQPTYGIGLCARCSRKFPLAELYPDPNSPGLMVCRDDIDDYDPYRLPARVTEDITLPFVRPDVSLTFDANDVDEDNRSLPVFLTGTNTQTSVSLSWTVPDFAQSFSVYRSVNGAGFVLVASLGANTYSYLDSGLDLVANTYTYYVVYEDELGIDSQTSNEPSFHVELLVEDLVFLVDIWRGSSAHFTVNTPAGCDVELVPTIANISHVPLLGFYPKPSGKYYWEALCTSVSGRPNSTVYPAAGVGAGVNLIGEGNTDTTLGGPATTLTYYQGYNGSTNGAIQIGDGTLQSISGGRILVGDVMNVAWDAALDKVWFGKNGVWLGSGTQNPATGQGGFFPTNQTQNNNPGSTIHQYFGPWHSADFFTTPETLQYRFSQQYWTYTPPTGFGEALGGWTRGSSPDSTPAMVDLSGVMVMQNMLPGLGIATNQADPANHQLRSQVTRGTGKRYFEVTTFLTATSAGAGGSANCFGVTRTGSSHSQDLVTSGVGVRSDGVVLAFGSSVGAPYGTTAWWTTVDGRASSTMGGGDTVMIAVDFVNQLLYVGMNGVWVAGQDPTSGTGGVSLTQLGNTDWVAAFSTGTSSIKTLLNTGGLTFLYSPPAGYLGWDE